MSEILPVVYLARHGETAWSATGQHTGLTDLPLTKRGERNALRLRKRLAGLVFAEVFTSPLQRAVRTCELAGFGAVARRDHDLVEWNYGDYEGLRTSEIRAKRPDWQLFRDGCPNGESPAQIGARSDCGTIPGMQATECGRNSQTGLPEDSLFSPAFIIFPRERAHVGNYLERAALCQCASRSRDRARPNAIPKRAARVDNCTSQSGCDHRANDARG